MSDDGAGPLRMPNVLRDNGLAIGFGLLFVGALIGQAFAGLADFNELMLSQGLEEIGFWRYVTSSDFAVDVSENWQSEYLQFFLYITATVWLVQRGSPESKPLGHEGRESDEDQKIGEHADEDSPAWARTRGVRLKLYSRSLGIVMGVIFLASWITQSITGHSAHSEQLIGDLDDPLTWIEYVFSSDFWNRTLQNWQSEFLAVGTMVVLSIYLRERGSPESKPVGAAASLHRRRRLTGAPTFRHPGGPAALAPLASIPARSAGHAGDTRFNTLPAGTVPSGRRRRGRGRSVSPLS